MALRNTQTSNLSFEDLLKLCEKRIITKMKKVEAFPGAFNDAKYLGCPGKDIFFALHKLDDKQMEQLAEAFTKAWPTKTGAHVGNAAAVRYIYGQFDKQGILLSAEAYQNMKKAKPNWDLPRKFLKILRGKLKEQKNYYAIAILCEMEGHRLGDEAVLGKDKKKLQEMVEMYKDSVKWAEKYESGKQRFTPYYWAAMYCAKFGDKAQAVELCRLNVEEAAKHCPDARGSYVEKILDCLRYLQKHDRKHFRWMRSTVKTLNNECVHRAFTTFTQEFGYPYRTNRRI